MPPLQLHGEALPQPYPRAFAELAGEPAAAHLAVERKSVRPIVAGSRSAPRSAIAAPPASLRDYREVESARQFFARLHSTMAAQVALHRWPAARQRAADRKSTRLNSSH